MISALKLLFGNLDGLLTKIVNNGKFSKLAALAAVVAAFGVMYTAVAGFIASIQLPMPEEIRIALTWVIPWNFGLCVTAYLSTITAVALFNWKKQQAKFLAGY